MLINKDTLDADQLSAELKLDQRSLLAMDYRELERLDSYT